MWTHKWDGDKKIFEILVRSSIQTNIENVNLFCVTVYLHFVVKNTFQARKHAVQTGTSSVVVLHLVATRIIIIQLEDIKSNLKKSDTWRIQLTIAINFASSKDNDQEYVMHLKSNNIKIMINDKVD